MTQEEKVALLKKAGVWDVIGFPSCIDKLFDLVAAHEREACANVCDFESHQLVGMGMANEAWAAKNCAAAIRARNVDSVYTSPERVEKTAESIRVVPANLCQNSTKLVSFGE